MKDIFKSCTQKLQTFVKTKFNEDLDKENTISINWKFSIFNIFIFSKSIYRFEAIATKNKIIA